jgi:B12-binding domain/radical SAM domain protein
MKNPELILLHAPSVYDFRRESILYGPVSDLVPSTPAFEMYPIGFTTIAEYLERFGIHTRIINLAVHMLDDAHFDVENYLGKLDAMAFGIDLHWLPHAHGSIEIARIVKRLHPNRPVIFGGFSSTYFHQELERYPAVDFVMRGDSTEAPMLALLEYIGSGGTAHPEVYSKSALMLASIPNLAWKDSDREVHVNPLAYCPENLDHILVDYTHVLRAVVRYRDLVGVKPFRNWMHYPITAALTARGCQNNCLTCGGSASTFRNLYGRQQPAFRSPEKLAVDIRRIAEYSDGPVFVLGDIRQAGDEYADRFIEAISGYDKPVIIELFDAAPRSFFEKLSKALPNWTLEISMETHDESIRWEFGRPYSNAQIERTMDDALDTGCKRLDLFFMIGLKGQTYQSVMESVDYSRQILQRYARDGEKRVIPFISPLAPFLDPGSRAFEQPEKYGYHLFAHTLEEHRQLLLAPSWKHVLNYETNWLNRDGIVSATYEAGRRMNRIKGEFGIITSQAAEATDRRIAHAEALMHEIDQIIARSTVGEQRRQLLNLKQKVDDSNLSTVCDKRELEIPLRGVGVNFLRAAIFILKDWLKNPNRRKQIRN